jgi:hypothetical protein
MTKLFAVASLVLFLVGCSASADDPKYAEYQQYRKERVLVKVCHSGEKIWQWQGKLWAKGPRYPDETVASIEVCT